MKPLYELAVVKDRNEIKGFVLGHEKYLIDSKKKIYTYKYSKYGRNECVS